MLKREGYCFRTFILKGASVRVCGVCSVVLFLGGFLARLAGPMELKRGRGSSRKKRHPFPPCPLWFRHAAIELAADEKVVFHYSATR